MAFQEYESQYCTNLSLLLHPRICQIGQPALMASTWSDQNHASRFLDLLSYTRPTNPTHEKIHRGQPYESDDLAYKTGILDLKLEV